MSAPSSASPLGTPRINAARYGGFYVRWNAVRYARTLEQAEALAELPLPPPRRWPPRSTVAPETVALARELRATGASLRAIARELDRREIRPPKSRLWNPSSVALLLR